MKNTPLIGGNDPKLKEEFGMIWVGILIGTVGTWAVSTVVGVVTWISIGRAWGWKDIADYRDEVSSTLRNIEWTLGKLSDLKRDQD